MKKNNYFKKILSNKVMIIGAFSFILLVVFSFLLYGKGTYSASEKGKCYDCSAGGGDPRVFVSESDQFYNTALQGCDLIDKGYTESQCLDASTSSHIVRLSPGEGHWKDGSRQPKNYEFTTESIGAMEPVKAFGLSRDEYEFDGWSPSEINTGLPDIPKDGIITSEYFHPKREPLVAKWKKVTKHIVSLSPGDEWHWKDGSRQPKNYEFTTDTISAMEPFNALGLERDGCEFDGWSPGIDTSLPDIPKDGTITSKYFAPNEVLAAKWNCDSPPSTRISVSFFASNGTSLLSQKYCDSGTCYGIDLPIPNIDKCSSDKWCLGKNSDCDSPIPSETITMSLYTKTTNYTCFAKDSSISSKKYSIKFYDYYGHKLFSDQTCTATLIGNTICELGSFNIPEKECFSWCTKSNGCDDSVTNAKLANLPVDSNKLFYCSSPIPYEVKMNLNNGKSSLTTKTIIPVSYYEKITFDDMYEFYLGKVTRDGYTLSGWCYDSNCSGTVLHQLVDYKEDGKTLYAQWKDSGSSSGGSSGGTTTSCTYQIIKPSGASYANGYKEGSKIEYSGEVYLNKDSSSSTGNGGLRKYVTPPTGKCFTDNWTVTFANGSTKTYSQYISSTASNGTSGDCGIKLTPQFGTCSSGSGSGTGTTDAVYSETINEDRCSNGKWVRVASCQPTSVKDAKCKLSDDTIVDRSTIMNSRSGCEILGNAYENVINDYRCNMVTGKWIYITSCQARSVIGAHCKYASGNVIRTDLSDGAYCSDPKPSTGSNDKTQQDVDNSAPTGTLEVVIAWAIGIIALFVSFYYFKKNKFVKE